jgi:hypothetical protein
MCTSSDVYLLHKSIPAQSESNKHILKSANLSVIWSAVDGTQTHLNENRYNSTTLNLIKPFSFGCSLVYS